MWRELFPPITIVAVFNDDGKWFAIGYDPEGQPRWSSLPTEDQGQAIRSCKMYFTFAGWPTTKLRVIR